MARIFSICIILYNLLLTLEVDAQIAPYRYWVQFRDKKFSSYSIEHPENFLSIQAIERRMRQNISIDETDLPVTKAYVDSLKAIGLTIINTSKWLNGVVVAANDTALINKASKFNFVAGIPLYPNQSEIIQLVDDKLIKTGEKSVGPSYGISFNQIEMFNGDYLHNKDYCGQGFLIAVLDAGFLEANKISSLQHLWKDNRVVAIYDFVKDGTSFYQANSHGTKVLSTIASIEEDILFGTAPKSKFALIRTEDVASEYLIEEYNWVCGAEFADSLGADIINSSLSYTEFNNSMQNHTYEDMNGKTNVSAIGASIAASKGILVVCSAGNNGNDLWHWIGSPADADSILTVGAVDPQGTITNFSSRGPSSDGRIKPDICAQGTDVICQYPSGEYIGAAGTSFSSPLIAGMAACLWQANPEASNIQVIESIRQSASQYSNPDGQYGYGIPDFAKADRILKNIIIPDGPVLLKLYSYPNPVTDILNIEVYNGKVSPGKQVLLSVLDMNGRKVIESVHTANTSVLYLTQDVSGLSTGVYRLVINIEGRFYSSLFIKTD